jgi:hypothetical protein
MNFAKIFNIPNFSQFGNYRPPTIRPTTPGKFLKFEELQVVNDIFELKLHS